MKKKIFGILFAVVLVFSLVGLWPDIADTIEVVADTNGKVSFPFQYSGYTFPQYSSYTRSAQYVAMSDGIELAATIYLPSEGPPADSFPVILYYTDKLREKINPATGQLLPQQSGFVEFFTSYGYVYVAADIRGCGASFGSRIDRGPILGSDGKDLVDWIAAQPWCNGNVGTVGISYTGFTQVATAGETPAALKAIFPECTEFEAYTGAANYPGGIKAEYIPRTVGPNIRRNDLNYHPPGSSTTFPSAPVVDEDGDGDLADEIPIDQDSDGYFHNDGPPIYSDGNPRQDIYYNATLEHLDNLYAMEISETIPYRDSPIPGLANSYIDLGPRYWPVTMSESGVAIYNWSGYFDHQLRGATQWFATLARTNPARMVLSPMGHGQWASPGPYWKYFGLVEDNDSLFMERLRFFDRFLKGVENGIDKEPPIYIYVMNGEGWRFEGEWPLGRQQTVNYYFAGGNTLTTTHPTSDGSDQYQVDFTTSALQNGIGRWHMNVSYSSKILKRTDKDLKCLTYTSEPLEQDVEVTGHPIVNLWVSSTADDGDFFVYLEDVDDTGEALYIADGMLRANFAGGLIPNEDILLPGADSIDVLPDLPWHGFRESDYVDGVFAGGEKVNLIFDLMPTSWVFKEGHRIRVSIAGADYPTFQLHPELSPTGEPDDPMSIVPDITVYRDAEHPSFISLPVIPVKATVFEGTARVKAAAKGHDEVPAELYTFETAVYLHYDDQWIKWDTTENWHQGMVEHYKCEGDLGKLSVLVQTNDRASFEALASGQGVHFKGVAK